MFTHLMNVAIEEISACQKRLKIEMPANRVNEELSKVTQSFQKHARIPGFREGKAPVNMVEKRFAKEIEEEFKRTIVPQAFREAVKQKSLRVVGAPHIEDLHFERGLSLSFSTIVDLAPEFPLPEYKGLKISAPSPDAVNDTKIGEVIERLATQWADYKAIEGRSLQEGDFAVIDFKGTVDGKPISELVPNGGVIGGADKFWLWAKKDIFLPGFAEGLFGANPGDKRQLTINFPADFGQAELTGKTATYDVTVSELKERVLPTVDDAFAQEKFKLTAEDLKKHIREDLEMEAKKELSRKQTQELIQHLLENAKFELPESLVQRETQKLLYDIVQRNQQAGISEAILEEKKSEIVASANTGARERVKLSFILSRIAEQEKIEVTNDDLNTEINTLSHMYRTPVQKLLQQLQENNAFTEVEDRILQRKTLEFLLKSAITQ